MAITAIFGIVNTLLSEFTIISVAGKESSWMWSYKLSGLHLGLQKIDHPEVKIRGDTVDHRGKYLMDAGRFLVENDLVRHLQSIIHITNV
jgi:hypothetical protein